jgi:hypothetical protein
MLPFTRDEFMAVFARYHNGTWPAVMVWFTFAVLLLAYIYRHASEKQRAGTLLAYLGLLWSWTGAAYMWGYFASINPAANYFGMFFLIQGLWILYESGKSHYIDLTAIPKLQLAASMFFFAYALVLYPLIGNLFGHHYPAAPIFGLPCPNTIFTFAALLLVRSPNGKMLGRLFVIPVAWSAIATVAAIQLSVPQDWMLPAAAIVTTVFALRQKARTMSSGFAPAAHA